MNKPLSEALVRDFAKRLSGTSEIRNHVEITVIFEVADPAFTLVRFACHDHPINLHEGTQLVDGHGRYHGGSSC